MHETEEELGKRAVAESSDNEPFSHFSLPDIYGRYTHPPGQEFEIDLETYKLLTSQDRTVHDQTIAAVQEKSGFPSISSYGNGGHEGRNFVVTPGPTRSLGFWVPQFTERVLLRGLASGLATGKDGPLVVEVEAGTGVISKMLAAESTIKVIVLEKDEERFNSLPTRNGDITLQTRDAWDIRSQFGPQYPPEVVSEVEVQMGNLRRLHSAVVNDEFNTTIREQEIAFNRVRYLAKVAVKRMQVLASQRSVDSQIDMLIYSAGNGDPNSFLTIAIRDGIQPKAIVYQREARYLQPIPVNWKEKYNYSYISNNTHDSADPGEHYRTVAVWRTFSRRNWEAHNYSHWSGVPQLQTEIIVQLRKDVKLTDVLIGSAPEYPFDNEILALLDKSGKAGEFIQGINDAREQLLAA